MYKYDNDIVRCSPTPKVTWTRTDGKPFSERVETGRSFGTEMLIRQVDFVDAGKYRCSASNMEGGSVIYRDFTLIVECKYHCSIFMVLALQSSHRLRYVFIVWRQSVDKWRVVHDNICLLIWVKFILHYYCGYIVFSANL